MAREYISPARSRALLGTQMTDSAKALRENLADYYDWQEELGATTAKGRAWGGYGLPILSYLIGGSLGEDSKWREWLQDPTILSLLSGVGSYQGSQYAQGQYPDAPDIRTPDILFGEEPLFAAEQEADLAASAFDASQITDAFQDLMNIFEFSAGEKYEFGKSPLATTLSDILGGFKDRIGGKSRLRGLNPEKAKSPMGLPAEMY